MNSLILCEGSTDAILLSYYLIKVYGWEVCKKAPDHLNIKESEANESVNWYKKDDNWLLICGVGGKDKMELFFREKIQSPMINSETAFSKFAVVLDHDDKSIESIESNASDMFSPVITDMKNNTWIDNGYLDSFGIKRNVESLLIIIPSEQQGALETLLLNVIAEDPYDEQIVKKTGCFVDEMRTIASRYISNNRMRLKAHLSVTWAIQTPDKAFSFMDEQIRSVPWERSEILRDSFQQLEKL